MTLRPTLAYLTLALALASGATWAATGKTSDDTAPATPGMSTPPGTDGPGTDVPGAPGKGPASVTDPTGANGALDMRHVEKPNTHPTPQRPASNDAPSTPNTPAPTKP